MRSPKNLLAFMLLQVSIFLTASLIFVPSSLANECTDLITSKTNYIIGLGQSLTQQIYTNGKTPPKTGEISQKFLDEINQLFELNSHTNLAFAIPPTEVLTEGQFSIGHVIEQKYDEGLSKGIIYIATTHDIDSHLIGFIRIAKTDAWRNAKKMLAGLVKIRQQRWATSPTFRQANPLIGHIATRIELVTADLSHGDLNPQFLESRIKHFESEINSFLEEYEIINKSAGRWPWQ